MIHAMISYRIYQSFSWETMTKEFIKDYTSILLIQRRTIEVQYKGLNKIPDIQTCNGIKSWIYT